MPGEYAPPAGNIFPEVRGFGLGERLVDAVVREAKRIGLYPPARTAPDHNGLSCLL